MRCSLTSKAEIEVNLTSNESKPSRATIGGFPISAAKSSKKHSASSGKFLGAPILEALRRSMSRMGVQVGGLRGEKPETLRSEETPFRAAFAALANQSPAR